jgi:hypothetical protein
MTLVELRDVVRATSRVFFAHQRDPAKTAMVGFPSRTEQAFLEHWRDRVLDDRTVVVRTIVAEARSAGMS